MPERFGIGYIGADGQKHTPVLIHRACYGSVERFLGILIEHYGGAFPLWLAPVQVTVLPVSDKTFDYARSVHRRLLEIGLRSEVNLKDDRLGYKIRDASLRRIPFELIVGPREAESGTVNVRSRDCGEIGSRTIDDFVAELEAWRKT